MTRFLTFLLIVVSAAGTGARALTVDALEAGTLAARISNPAAVTALSVNGAVDASDLMFIGSEMPALTSLDLSGAHVAAYDGEPLDGVRHFDADALPPMSLAGIKATTVKFPATLARIDAGALAGSAITELVLPATVVAVGDGAFAGCLSLRSASLGKAALGAGALAGCASLQSAATSAEALPERCFAGCPSLEAVEAPVLTTIGDRAFEGCAALAKFDFPPSLVRIGSRAFAASGLREADMEHCGSLQAVGAGAFASCPALQVLAFPEKSIEAGHALAMGSTELRTALLPEGDVPAYALAGDESADATTALRRAGEVGEYALQGVSGAAEVSLPASLEYLGDGAMEGMTGLRQIDATALQSVPELGSDVWKDVRQAEVVLKASPDMAAAFAAAGQWQDFKINTSGTTSVKDEVTGRIRARFEGTTLIVECRGTDAVASVRLHDTAGHLLAVLSLTPDGMAAADTSRWSENVYLVSAFDATDNLLITIKIARNG